MGQCDVAADLAKAVPGTAEKVWQLVAPLPSVHPGGPSGVLAHPLVYLSCVQAGVASGSNKLFKSVAKGTDVLAAYEQLVKDSLLRRDPVPPLPSSAPCPHLPPALICPPPLAPPSSLISALQVQILALEKLSALQQTLRGYTPAPAPQVHCRLDHASTLSAVLQEATEGGGFFSGLFGGSAAAAPVRGGSWMSWMRRAVQVDVQEPPTGLYVWGGPGSGKRCCNNLERAGLRGCVRGAEGLRAGC